MTARPFFPADLSGNIYPMNTEESAYVRAWRFLGNITPDDVFETPAPAHDARAKSPKRRRKAVKKLLPALHGPARAA